MTPRRIRRERAGRREPAGTAVAVFVPEPDTVRQIDAALDRSTRPGAAFPLGEPLHAQAPREPSFTPSRGLPALPPAPPQRRDAPPLPGPVPLPVKLHTFAEVTAPLPSLLWCAGCGRDFTDDATAGYDRMLQYLHIRAAETGWRRDARGLLRCPACQQSHWMAAWCPPVLAGGARAEAALRESVEGPLPESRREFMPPPGIAFSAPLEAAATETRDEDGPRITVDWESLITRSRQPAVPPGGRHARHPGPALPGLSHYGHDKLAGRTAGRRAS